MLVAFRLAAPFRLATAVRPRQLCTGFTKKPWDGASAVHGTPQAAFSSVGLEAEAAQGNSQKNARSAASGEQLQRPFSGRQGATTTSSSSHLGGLSPTDKADLLHFQVYVRQRLSELSARMPPRLGTRERAELAFLEEQVVQDHMPSKKRRIRDPLSDVDEREIRHTNLPLLSRFVSEAGAILPKRLTGVSPAKQRTLTRAIKRSQVLALMPRSWKLPRYRHSSYADQYSLPERPPPTRNEDDEFRDAPDIRFPNQWENKRVPLEIDLTRLVRASPGLPPRPATTPPDAHAKKPSWPSKGPTR